jgi:hypothetical protein
MDKERQRMVLPKMFGGGIMNAEPSIADHKYEECDQCGWIGLAPQDRPSKCPQCNSTVVPCKSCKTCTIEEENNCRYLMPKQSIADHYIRVVGMPDDGLVTIQMLKRKSVYFSLGDAKKLHDDLVKVIEYMESRSKDQ